MDLIQIAMVYWAHLTSLAFLKLFVTVKKEGKNKQKTDTWNTNIIANSRVL